MYLFSARVLEDLRLRPLCVCAPAASVRPLPATVAAHRVCGCSHLLMHRHLTGGTTLITCTETITLHYITCNFYSLLEYIHQSNLHLSARQVKKTIRILLKMANKSSSI